MIVLITVVEEKVRYIAVRKWCIERVVHLFVFTEQYLSEYGEKNVIFAT